MTNPSRGVAVVATHVAQTDRRALSEAWYSALHLSEPAAAPRGSTAVAPESIALPVPRHSSPVTAGAVRYQPPAPRPPALASDPAAPAVDRRRIATPAVRRIERAVVRLRAQSLPRASQTLDLAGGRVRLLVRTDAVATRIIAVCAPALREAVERALAHARFALAAGGAAVTPP